MKVRVGQCRFLPFLDHEQDTMLKRTGYNRGILCSASGQEEQIAKNRQVCLKSLVKQVTRR